MKMLLAFLLAIPCLSQAAGMNWTAFDLERCKPWYFDIGQPQTVSEDFKKKYHREPYGDTEAGRWRPIVATSNDNPPVFYYAECFQSNKDKTLRCHSYGENAFPLGDAVYKYKSFKTPTNPGTLVCIKNCASIRIKAIYDHWYEPDPDTPLAENTEYENSKKVAHRNCGEVGNSW